MGTTTGFFSTNSRTLPSRTMVGFAGGAGTGGTGAPFGAVTTRSTNAINYPANGFPSTLVQKRVS